MEKIIEILPHERQGHIYFQYNVNGLMQESRISIAYALELHLSCTKPSIYAAD